MLDRPMASLDLTVFWMRRLLDYDGRLPAYFYRQALRMRLFTYFHIDLALAVLSVLFLLFSK
jgi:hypothetical protein